jgi:hypothetical protein
MSSVAALDFTGVKVKSSRQHKAMNSPYRPRGRHLITLAEEDCLDGEIEEYYQNLKSVPKDELRRRHAEPKSVVRKVAAPEQAVDVKNGKFPYCLVWVPLPIIAWLVPFVGHVGICRQDGVILDFAGVINIDNLAFGSTAKYVSLRAEECCFPDPKHGHTCSIADQHAVAGMAYSWDDAVSRSAQVFGRKLYNFFSCNCHSFVANCLNRMAYGGYTNWNLMDVLLLALVKGQFVDYTGFLRAYVPFVAVMSFGLYMAGWAFFHFWAGFAFLLIGWFTYGTYAFGGYIDC